MNALRHASNVYRLPADVPSKVCVTTEFCVHAFCKGRTILEHWSVGKGDRARYETRLLRAHPHAPSCPTRRERS